MTDNSDLYERFFKCLGLAPEAYTQTVKRPITVQPNTRVILERAIEEGTKRGYKRAFKHTDSPSEPLILQSIEDAIWLEIDTYFNFDDNGLL